MVRTHAELTELVGDPELDDNPLESKSESTEVEDDTIENSSELSENGRRHYLIRIEAMGRRQFTTGETTSFRNADAHSLLETRRADLGRLLLPGANLPGGRCHSSYLQAPPNPNPSHHSGSTTDVR